MALTSVELAKAIEKPVDIRSRKSAPLLPTGIFGSASLSAVSDDRGDSGTNRRRRRKASVVMHLTPDLPGGQDDNIKRSTSSPVGSVSDSRDEQAQLPCTGQNVLEMITASSGDACMSGLIVCSASGILAASNAVQPVLAGQRKGTATNIPCRRAIADRAVGKANDIGMETVEGDSEKADGKPAAESGNRCADMGHVDVRVSAEVVDLGMPTVDDADGKAASRPSLGSGSRCGKRRTFNSAGVVLLFAAGSSGASASPTGFHCYLCLLDEELAATERTSDDDEEEEEEEERAAAAGAAAIRSSSQRRPPSFVPFGSLWELMDHVSAAHVKSEMLDDDGGGRSSLSCALCLSRFVVVDGVEDSYIRAVYHAYEKHGWPLPAFMKDAVRCQRCGCVLAVADALQQHRCITHEVSPFEKLLKLEQIENERRELRLVAGRLRRPLGAVKCPACGTKRPNRVALSSHVRLCHSEGGEGLFTCPFCSISMLLGSVNEHMRRCHSDHKRVKRKRSLPARVACDEESTARQSSPSADTAFECLPLVKTEIDGGCSSAVVPLQRPTGGSGSFAEAAECATISSIPTNSSHCNDRKDDPALRTASAAMPAVVQGVYRPDAASTPSLLQHSQPNQSLQSRYIGFVPRRVAPTRKAVAENQTSAGLPAKVPSVAGAAGRLASSNLSSDDSAATAAASFPAGSSSSSSVGLMSDERLMCTRCCKRILGAANLARHMEVIHGVTRAK